MQRTQRLSQRTQSFLLHRRKMRVLRLAPKERKGFRKERKVFYYRVEKCGFLGLHAKNAKTFEKNAKFLLYRRKMRVLRLARKERKDFRKERKVFYYREEKCTQRR
jgi:hypothetical protein